MSSGGLKISESTGTHWSKLSYCRPLNTFYCWMESYLILLSLTRPVLWNEVSSFTFYYCFFHFFFYFKLMNCTINSISKMSCGSSFAWEGWKEVDVQVNLNQSPELQSWSPSWLSSGSSIPDQSLQVQPSRWV